MPYNSIRGLFVRCFLMMVLSLSLCGCKTTITPLVRFQSVPVPMYDRSDYEALLASGDAETKYNAISNLIPHARTYADILEHGSLSDSTERVSTNEADPYAQAQWVLLEIREGLQSDNENIKAASLMFLAELAPIYSQKKGLFAAVSQTRSRNIRTQYEQLNTLVALVEPDTEVDRTIITGFLDSRSWLIKSMAYHFLSHIVCDDVHLQLIHAYRKTSRDYDRLLVLSAFRKHYGADVFELFKNELLASENPRIKGFIAEMLPAYHDAADVSQWLAGVHPALHDDVVLRIFDRYAEKLRAPQGVSFFEGLLASTSPRLTQLLGRSLLVESLYQAMEQEPARSDLIRLRDLLLNNETLKVRWDIYAEEHAQAAEAFENEEALRAAILPRYTELLERFLKDAQRLLADYGMEAEEIEQTTEDIRELLQIFQEASTE